MASPTPETPIQHSPSARSQRRPRRRLFAYLSRREIVRINRLLRREFVGGLIIMVAALVGFIAANSPIAEWFLTLREFKIGPEALGLHMSVGHWASDGLLAIFFFMVGLGVVMGAELNAALAEASPTALRGEIYSGPFKDELEVEEPQPGEDVEVVPKPETAPKRRGAQL